MGNANMLNLTALVPYLEDQVPGFSGYLSIDKFNTGQSNPTYLIRTESGSFVLRAKPPGQLLKSAHQVDREYRVMQALRESEVPVPRVLHLAGEDSPIGRMFYVMEYVEGRIFWDPVLPELADQSERTAIYDAINKTLAALHDVDFELAGLSGFGKPGNYFERQYSRWLGQYRASEITPDSHMEQLILWLQANLPADDGIVSLVHGDYRLDNMIIHPDRPEVAAVLDWELSTLGHPLADLSYQCMQWRLPHDSGFRGLGGIDRANCGLPTEEAYVEAYCRRRNIAKIADWSFCLAFSFFRLAAILQGVSKRALDGNASNPEIALRYGALVPLVAQTAILTIDA